MAKGARLAAAHVDMTLESRSFVQDLGRMNREVDRSIISLEAMARQGRRAMLLGGAAIGFAVIDSSIYRMIVAVTVLSLMTSPIWIGRLMAPLGRAP